MFDLKNILDSLNAMQGGANEPAESIFPPEKERHLCAGMLLTLNSCLEPRELSLGIGAEMVISTLQSAWNVSDADDLRQTIGILLSDGQHLGMDPAIVAIHAAAQGDADDEAIQEMLVEAFGEDDAEALRAAEAGLIEAVGPLGDSLTSMRDIHAKIGTLRAWDIERAAFNARMGFEAGFFDEAEAFAVLEKARLLAEATYDNWRSYGIAFVLGRIIGYSDDCDFLISELGASLETAHSLYNTYPFDA
ncbi:DUF1266 domain-containing protein [Dyella japonica]|uniref:DUF1266 domain-containing protein n=1 Tax=Dyella japonica TaxID=231455 RepID=A0ABV2K459_9GAMM